MILQESVSTAVDAIRANLLRSLLTTIAIVIGTASVIAMVGIGSSAQRAISTRCDHYRPRRAPLCGCPHSPSGAHAAEEG